MLFDTEFVSSDFPASLLLVNLSPFILSWISFEMSSPHNLWPDPKRLNHYSGFRFQDIWQFFSNSRISLHTFAVRTTAPESLFPNWTIPPGNSRTRDSHHKLLWWWACSGSSTPSSNSWRHADGSSIHFLVQDHSIFCQNSVTLISPFSFLLRNTFNLFNDFIVSLEDLGDVNDFFTPFHSALSRHQ